MSREKFLEPFSTLPSFPTSRASIDRVDCAFGRWELRGNPERLTQFIAHSSEDMFAPETSSGEMQFFKRTVPNDLSHRVILETRGNPRSWSEQHLIFSGALTGTTPHAPIQPLKLILKLNVTRAIQAQHLIGRIEPPKPKIKPPYYLTIIPSKISSDFESPYISSTNVLMGSPHRFAYALSKKPSEHLQDLLRALQSAVQRGFESNQIEYGDISLETPYQFGLREIEVYWEFECDYPIDTVNLLAPKLVAAANNSRTYTRKIDSVLEAVEHQSKSIQIELTKDTLIRVYAKTTKRIRVEVIYKKRKIEKLVGKRTTANERETEAQVDTCVQAASREATELFEYISNQHSIRELRHSADDLVREINRATDDPNIASHILHGLRHHGRIIPEYNQPLLQAVRKLRKRKVMRLVRKQQSCYVLTIGYQQALENMQYL
jgi:hypothetical protein